MFNVNVQLVFTAIAMSLNERKQPKRPQGALVVTGSIKTHTKQNKVEQ